jgi:hypothetical protein
MSVELGTSAPIDLVSADFTRDGRPDVMVTPYTSLLASLGDGSFAEVQRATFFNASALAAGDFTSDGTLDVAITQATKGFTSTYGDPCGSLPSVGIFVRPAMTLQNCLFAGAALVSAESADFDRDGAHDLAVVSRQGQGLRILKGLGTGAFAPMSANGPNGVVPNSLVNAVSLASPIDLDGDQHLDLVLAHNGGVRTFTGNGDGTFVVAANLGTTQMTAVAAADLNADNLPEIVSVDALGRVLLHLASAGGTYTSTVVATIGVGLTDVAIADLDRNDLNDIVVAYAGGNALRMFFSNGDATFDEEALALSFKPKLLAVRDWDEDGDADLAMVDTPASGQPAHLWVALQSGAPPDLVAPSIGLTAPSARARLTGTVVLRASATDNIRVTRVQFFVGTTLIATSTGPDFSVSWDTTAWPDGPVQVGARAFDAAMNQSRWTRVVATVANALSVPIDTVPLVSVGDDVLMEAVATTPPRMTTPIDRTLAARARAVALTCTAAEGARIRASQSFGVTVRKLAPVLNCAPQLRLEVRRRRSLTGRGHH